MAAADPTAPLPPIVTDAALAALTLLAFAMVGPSMRAAPALGLTPIDACLALLALGAALLAAFAYRMLIRLGGCARRVRREGRDCAGTVAVEFILVLPVLIYTLSSIVQTALLGQAALITRHAAFCAARTAIVNTERGLISDWNQETVTDDGAEDALTSAVFILGTISPNEGGGTDLAAEGIRDIRSHQGAPWIDNGYPARVAFARAATTLELNLDSPFGIPNPAAPRVVEADLTYRYLLVGPGVAKLLVASRSTIGGVEGRFFPITSKVTLQSTGPREGSLLSVTPLAGKPIAY